MKAQITSYIGLFDADGKDFIEQIEIPIIQRDYAQGRPQPAVVEIRDAFVDVLLDAINGRDPVGLDFVYGRLDGTTLRPLDGQQRLTTLFLLHWYVASLSGNLSANAPWLRFAYRTRLSARRFCERLAHNPLAAEAERPSVWLTDQAWYLHIWHDDPTIEAMLVMLDAIHDGASKRRLDATAAWERLSDRDNPVISFHRLLLDDMDSDEDLYIKMNSRGKPLTPFENFKARFEQDISASRRAKELAHRIDGPWTDLLWAYHGGDHVIDDEFLRYFGYLTEICELRDGRLRSGRIGPRARAVFGSSNPSADEHLEFLFAAFDVWKSGDEIRSTFADLFSTAQPGQTTYDPNKAVLFGASSTNLFEDCCRNFEIERVTTRTFSLQQSLLLYAVLLHKIASRDEPSYDANRFPRRLRVLRNLIAASDDEVRRNAMPALLQDVQALVLSPDMPDLRTEVTRFNLKQRLDEQRKQQFVESHPESVEVLNHLEDQPILRGTLVAFPDLDPRTLPRRTEAFEAAFTNPNIWHLVTGALLAVGEYQWRGHKPDLWYFGTGSTTQLGRWRYVLATGLPQDNDNTAEVLARFLEGFASRSGHTEDRLHAMIEEFTAARETEGLYDWRYYLVKYPDMRSGDTGIYYGADGRIHYTLCMLRRTQLNSWYRDPIHLQIYKVTGVGDRLEDPWYSGWDYEPRWLTLAKSQTALRSIDRGFEVYAPTTAKRLEKFHAVCDQRGDIVDDTTGEGDAVLEIPQARVDGILVDTVNRVEVAAQFVRELTAAGL